jgi:indole-3-glycerol phosphate synthase
MESNILEQIVAYKKTEVESNKAAVPARELEKSPRFSREPLSLRQSLLHPDASGIIAEFKRKSPSKGWFSAAAEPGTITRAYAQGGASGLSVLTDAHFFGGHNNDLLAARAQQVPVLRKDFVVDEYQVLEAKAIGADVILLIAACLTPGEIKTLSALARSLGMEVLLEVHDAAELDQNLDAADLVGVNNRDLKTFRVDINRSLTLSDKIPAGKIAISESGISDVATILQLKQYGFKGFLIGETFMKEKDPAIAFASFVHQLKTGNI